jgi:hypothetical protein
MPMSPFISPVFSVFTSIVCDSILWEVKVEFDWIYMISVFVHLCISVSERREDPRALPTSIHNGLAKAAGRGPVLPGSDDGRGHEAVHQGGAARRGLLVDGRGVVLGVRVVGL